MSLEQALSNIERIQQSAPLKDCSTGEHINGLFNMLKDSLEKEIVKQRCKKIKQSSMYDFVKRN